MEDDREKDILPTIEEVQDAVKKLKNYKAPGTDMIPVEMLKYGLQVLEGHICQLLRLIWKHVKLPVDWYIGKIVSIHKKRDQLSCDNY